LGVVPFSQELRKPTLNQIAHQVRGEFIAGTDHKRRRASKIIIGAMSSRNAESFFEAGTLLITPGDREDLILTALGASHGQIAGVLLTGNLLPQEGVLQVIQSRNLPFITSKYDSYTVASAINRMTVKTEVGDRDKISLIQSLVESHVDIDRIIQAAMPKENPQLPLI
jgi:BioD-like phosphotransacetylase family protein